MPGEEKKEDVEETTSEETKPDTPNDDIKPKDDEEEKSPEDESADKIADMLRRIEKLETENENLRAMIKNFGLNDKIGVTDGDNDGDGDPDSDDEPEPEEVRVEDLFKNKEND